MPIRVVIADDHRLVLDALREALAPAEDFTVVGEAASGTEVLSLVLRLRPDLVLMDVRMPDLDGLTALGRLRRRHPAVKVVLLSASADPEDIQAALVRGAAAYLLKSINPDDLPGALRQALEGTAHFAPPAAGESPERWVRRTAGLSERELAILKALARGSSNREIAAAEWITERTVKFHLSNIYRKIGVRNRAAAVRYAHARGLAEGEPATL